MVAPHARKERLYIISKPEDFLQHDQSEIREGWTQGAATALPEDVQSPAVPSAPPRQEKGSRSEPPAAKRSVHSANQSFYAYGPPGTPHSDFVRIVSSKLPYHVRPDKPSRTLNDWLAATTSVPEVLNLIGTYGAEFDGTNTATAMHRLAKWHREAPHHRLFEDHRWHEVLSHLERNMQAPNFQSRQLTGALWSFATLGRHIGARTL
eukprot:s986_g20.t1